MMFQTCITAILGALSFQSVHALPVHVVRAVDAEFDIDAKLNQFNSSTLNFIRSIPKCASECFDVQFYDTDECDYDNMACHCRWERHYGEVGELIYRVMDCINAECDDRPEFLQNVTRQFEKACKGSGVDFQMDIPGHEWERLVNRTDTTAGHAVEAGSGMFDGVVDPGEDMNPGGFAGEPCPAETSAAAATAAAAVEGVQKKMPTRKHPRQFLWPDNPTPDDVQQSSDTAATPPLAKRTVWWWPWTESGIGRAADAIDEDDLDEDGVPDAEEFEIENGPSIINDHRPSLLDLPRIEYPGEPTKHDIIDWVNENDLVMVNDLLPKKSNPEFDSGKAADTIDENDLDEDGVPDAEEFDIENGPSIINDHRPSLLDLPRIEYPGEPTKHDIIDWVNENDPVMVNDLLPKKSNPESGSDTAQALADWPFLETNHSGSAPVEDLTPESPKPIPSSDAAHALADWPFLETNDSSGATIAQDVVPEPPVPSSGSDAAHALADWPFLKPNRSSGAAIIEDLMPKNPNVIADAIRRSIEEADVAGPRGEEEIETVEAIVTDSSVYSFPGEANALREAGSLYIGKKAGFRAEDGKMYVWEFVEEPDKFKKVTDEPVDVSGIEKRQDSEGETVEDGGDVEHSDEAYNGTLQSEGGAEAGNNTETETSKLDGDGEDSKDAENTEHTFKEHLDATRKAKELFFHIDESHSYGFADEAKALRKLGLLRRGTTAVFRGGDGKMYKWEFVEFPDQFKAVLPDAFPVKRVKGVRFGEPSIDHKGDERFSGFSIQQVFPDEGRALEEAGLLHRKVRAVFPDYDGKMAVWRLVDYPDKFKKVLEASHEEDGRGYYDHRGNWVEPDLEQPPRKRAEGEYADGIGSVRAFPGLVEALGPEFDIGQKVAFRDADGKLRVWQFVSKPDKFEKLSDDIIPDSNQA